MRVESNIRPLSLSRNVWFYLTFVVLIALPLVLALAFQYEIYDWFLEQVVEPRAEKAMGFHGQMINVRGKCGNYEIYAVTSVAPGGAFAKAGIEPGDIPYGYEHGNRSGFIGQLNSYRGRTVEVRVMNCGKVGSAGANPRRVMIDVPNWSNL